MLNNCFIIKRNFERVSDKGNFFDKGSNEEPEERLKFLKVIKINSDDKVLLSEEELAVILLKSVSYLFFNSLNLGCSLFIWSSTSILLNKDLEERCSFISLNIIRIYVFSASYLSFELTGEPLKKMRAGSLAIMIGLTSLAPLPVNRGMCEILNWIEFVKILYFNYQITIACLLNTIWYLK